MTTKKKTNKKRVQHTQPHCKKCKTPLRYATGEDFFEGIPPTPIEEILEDIEPVEIYYCDKCKEEQEIPKPSKYRYVLNESQAEKIEPTFLTGKGLHTTLNTFRGQIIEYAAAKYYKGQGWFPIKLTYTDPSSLELKLNPILKDKCKAYGNQKVYRDIKKKLAGLPDYLCINHEAVCFVECKSPTEVVRRKKPNENQKKRFYELQKAGYKIRIFRAKVSLHDNPEKITVGTISLTEPLIQQKLTDYKKK